MMEDTPMGWSEHRIEEYRQGQRATWLERRMLEHANPVHFPLALAASAGFIYGLWTHDWLWIIGSSALALLGTSTAGRARAAKSDTKQSPLSMAQ
jgi:hypothetical protein